MSVAEAKNERSEFIEKVEDGEEVVIERDGRPVVQIVKAKPKGKKGSSASYPAKSRKWIPIDGSP